MNRKILPIHLVLALPVVAVACSPLPTADTPAAIGGTLVAVTDTPLSLPPSSGGGECGSSDYFPTDEDSVWEIAGTNSLLGDYTSTSTITESRDDGFTVRRVTTSSDVDFILDYGCTEAGLVMLNPMGQFGTASATGPNGSATVNTTAASGLTLPYDLYPGESWQQYLAFDVVGQDVTIQGEYKAESIVRGLEIVTVPFGTFEAMRVDTEVQSTINGEPWAPCTQTVWFAKDVGAVKAVSSCGGIDDSGELVSYDSP